MLNIRDNSDIKWFSLWFESENLSECKFLIIPKKYYCKLKDENQIFYQMLKIKIKKSKQTI